MDGSLQTNTRSIRASRQKLIRALYAGGMKTQAQLAEKIAFDEQLHTIPKNLVNKVFTGKPVDMLSLERVASGLGVETHEVVLTSDEVGKPTSDLEEDAQSQAPRETSFTGGLRRQPHLLLIFAAGALTASLLIYFLLLNSSTYQNSAQVDDYTEVSFAFTHGTPPRGYGVFNGVMVSLETLNAEKFGYSIRDLLDTSTSKIELIFSEPINYFRMDVSYVLPPDEFLTNFSIGLPTRTTGSMEIVDDVVTSNIPGDNGAGALIWEGISATKVYFEIRNIPDSTAMPALAIDSFGFRAEAE